MKLEDFGINSILKKKNIVCIYIVSLKIKVIIGG